MPPNSITHKATNNKQQFSYFLSFSFGSEYNEHRVHNESYKTHLITTKIEYSTQLYANFCKTFEHLKVMQTFAQTL